MRYSEARQGRVFILRLEDGEVLHEAVEAFARDKGIRAAALFALGGADEGSRLVVGPRGARGGPPEPMELCLPGVAEAEGVGTIFPNEAGEPVLHMHLACGRESETRTGCVRRGVKVWHVLELVLWELLDTGAARRLEAASGFELLDP